MSRRQPRKVYYAGNVMMMQGKEAGQKNDEWTSSYGQNTHSVKYVVEGENVECEDYLKGRRWALNKVRCNSHLKWRVFAHGFGKCCPVAGKVVTH